ncbi:type IV pilus assembly protein PilV [Tahibacter aquaticus]|uniref:Type IV pilus assembly protein PilV n=1 Tax=Tahibacter aquaticus TaxID=520092 RepID=A0A4R6YWE6_9GAMM|nr:type IV pilus modification protein PilV [Tahibacter aquaticus]TDR43105.1 type IV pilus assembly protein PilV [Tahibacter aquaticus]
MKGNRGSRGFTLLEVLIAVVILGIGLLGLAGLLMVSVRTNQSAYLRTQASFMAQSMADRMRGNLRGIWAGSYNATVPTGSGNAGAATTCPCNSAQLATRDLFWWSQEIHTLLPNSGATIACVRRPGSPIAGQNLANATQARLSFDGVCTISIVWNESTLNVGGPGAASASTPEVQTFVWAFQP